MPVLVAVGIISAPEFIKQRSASRHSWLRRIGQSPIVAKFVIRTLGAPPAIAKLLALEQAAHGDMLQVKVPWDAGRLRGPVLCVAAWLAHVTHTISSARFVAKLDDDAFINVPQFVPWLAEVARAVPAPERVYLGPMSWFHWQPLIFERTGFGWSYATSWLQGQLCRNETAAEERCRWRGCGACVGPFPFASGYLTVLSAQLAAHLTADATLSDDVQRLAQAKELANGAGGVAHRVMEDVWLGSVIYRRPPEGPISYVALSEADKVLISDGFGLRVLPSSLVVHVRYLPGGQQTIERFLAVDAFLREAGCQEPLTLTCRAGCRGFFDDADDAPPRKLRSSAVQARQLWLQRIGNASFCSGGQREAAYCRTRPTRARRCEGVPHDLLLNSSTRWVSADVVERARAVQDATSRLRQQAIAEAEVDGEGTG